LEDWRSVDEAWRPQEDPSLNLTVLHDFTTGPSGFITYYAVARDSAGNLYRTTMEGGNNACDCGVVFAQEAAGTYTVLHRFSGGEDGSLPYSGLLHSGEYLYGTASGGGANGEGVVFRIRP
jgi:uncharacterized repeat protein (TIGR03803 family)